MATLGICILGSWLVADLVLLLALLKSVMEKK